MGRIICGMLVGPGEGHRHLDRVLRLAAGWADTLLIYADGVDSDTKDALHSHPSTLVRWGTPSLFRQSESLVRNRLMEHLDEHCDEGDLVVILDADEELRGTDPDPYRDLRRAAEDERYELWPAEFFHIWSRDGYYRTDGGWMPSYGVRIYRHAPGARIAERTLACDAIPDLKDAQRARDDQSPFVIWHWGYARAEDRQPKQDFYLAHDGGSYHNLSHLKSITQEPVLAPL